MALSTCIKHRRNVNAFGVSKPKRTSKRLHCGLYNEQNHLSILIKAYPTLNLKTLLKYAQKNYNGRQKKLNIADWRGFTQLTFWSQAQR